MAADEQLVPGAAGAAAGRRYAVLAGSLWLLVAGVESAAWGALALAAGEPWWHVAVNAVVLVVPATVGAALAARLPGNPIGWLLLASAAAAAVAAAAGRWADSHPAVPLASWAAWADAVLWALGPPLLPLIALLFPDGRPVGRAGRWGVRAAVSGIALVAVASALLPGRLAGFSSSPGPANPIGVPALAGWVPVVAGSMVVLLVSAAVLAIFTLAWRWRMGRGTERLALAAVGAPLVVALALHLIAGAVGSDAVAIAATVVAAIGVPAGVWVAVARYRLYDLDLAIARTLAYGIVAVGLAVVFAATATAVGLVAGGESRIAVAAAAAATAMAFAGVRSRAVGFIERSVLGPAGDPQRAAALVGRRLAMAQDPDLLPELAAEAVADVLRLRHVRVVPRGQAHLAADQVECPLSHHGVELGTLAVSAPVTAAARRALTAVAEPVAAALHAAALTDAVRRSRTELVAAVEEERRRLRRELHDGLGPRLATLAMGIDAANNRVAGTAAEPGVAAVLARLRAQTDEMLKSIRHIVSELRPPALDQHGLSEALRLHAAEIAEPGGLTVEVVSGDLGPLTAAVEVAAYRIAAEAMLNAARHSGGRQCRLALASDNGLRLTITDDGRGIPDRCPTGVGTHSMRERAAALGGWVAIGPAANGGTEVRAWLPAVPA
jgi:two-component system NarL family sensor kinase